jgi:uncharacterized membrane protein
MTKDTKLALLKSISWHFVHTTILSVTLFTLTGELSLVAAIVSVHVISETIVYYLHERAWLKFKWGRKI